jgi:hypothetical protein
MSMLKNQRYPGRVHHSCQFTAVLTLTMPSKVVDR